MIEVRDASFAYAGAGRALDGVSLRVAPGERVVLLGRNGSGKSTLGRLLNGGLVASSGFVSVDGEKDRRQTARLVGYVRQDPRNQIVSSLVEDEVAFGPRNLGLARDEVRERVAEALSSCGIEGLRGRLTAELSGGQQQLVALAGVLAMRPRYLVLDEVEAQLDEGHRRRVRAAVRRALDAGVGVLGVAHAADAVLGADRVVVLEAGRVAWEGAPQEFFACERALMASGLSEDPLARAWAGAVADGYQLRAAPDPDGLAAWMRARGRRCEPGYFDHYRITSPKHLLLARELEVMRYGATHPALKGASWEAPSGVTLLLGATGSGKTTTARVAAGVLQPDSGEVLLDGTAVRAGRVGLAFQRPEDQLFADTVLEDIAYGPRALGAAPEEAEAAARAAAGRLGVPEELLERSPFELSGGQARRVALAGVIAARQGALVLDEPTAGLDAPARRALLGLVCELAAEGVALLVITHDAGEWLSVAREVVFLAEGAVVARAPAERAAREPGLFEAAGLVPPLSVRLRAAWEGGAHA